MKNHFKKLIITVLIASIPTLIVASDDGPRMYWNAPVGLNILQVYGWNVQSNTISINNEINNPNVNSNINLLLVGYNRIFDTFGHSSIFTTMITTGQVDGNIDIGATSISRKTSGFGDIYFQGTFNIFGAPALNIEEFSTYKQERILSVLLGVTAPTGKYDDTYLINMGANRWSVRLGMPFVQTIGDWTPGSITTFELVPSVWFYGDNDNFYGNTKLEQDPLYTIEAHITQDLGTSFYTSLDYLYQTGGETSLDGLAQDDSQNVDFIGASLAYQATPQIQFVLRYNTPLNPNPIKELDADTIQFNFNYVW